MGLFDPAWMTSNPKKAHKAAASVGKIKDQKLLKKIVFDAPLIEVKDAAIGAITDTKIIEDIAFCYRDDKIKNVSVSAMAASKLKDKDKLILYAATSPVFTPKVVQLLQEDQAALTRILKESPCPMNRYEASRYSTDIGTMSSLWEELKSQRSSDPQVMSLQKMLNERLLFLKYDIRNKPVGSMTFRERAEVNEND